MRSGGVFSSDELDLKDGYASFRFAGEGAHETFAPEAGGHRVQRVPPTEKKGRRQSSTVTVAVLPEPTPQELKIRSSDLKYETYRGTGPGGQHRNTSDTAVRVTHVPTGIQACSEIKSQAQNKKLALNALMARLAARQENKAARDRNKRRKGQVGTGMRSDKIRTIAYQRDRVENHLNGKRMSIKRYERGYVDEIQ
ncbi:MAG: peptide chain release factor-like protein [Nitrospiraceae bacterium]